MAVEYKSYKSCTPRGTWIPSHFLYRAVSKQQQFSRLQGAHPPPLVGALTLAQQQRHPLSCQRRALKPPPPSPILIDVSLSAARFKPGLILHDDVPQHTTRRPHRTYPRTASTMTVAQAAACPAAGVRSWERCTHTAP